MQIEREFAAEFRPDGQEGCREETALFGRADRRGPAAVESGVPVGDLCRQVGISEQTFYRWKKRYGGRAPSETREVRQLREENMKLRRLVADLSLDNVMLQDVLEEQF